MAKNDPKEVRVTVRVTDLAAEKFQFVSTDLTVGGKNHLTFNDGKDHKGFHILYELDGADGYRFPEDLSEALYVEHGTTCPQSKSSWGQFQAIAVLPGKGGERRVLKVWNKNEKQKKGHRDFAYTLRAKKDSKWLTLDPGGTNNNGGIDDFEFGASSNVIVGAVAAIGLLAVAFVVLK